MNWKNYFAIAGVILWIFAARAATLPAETNIFIRSGAYLLVPGDSWKYNNLGINLETDWRELDFDDASWPEGATQIGNLDGDEVTPIDLGPVDNRYPTIYFRRDFVVDEASRYTNLTLRLLRDDGAVVYLNGIEIYRSNMPSNEVTYYTWASTSVPTRDEQTNFYSYSFFPTNLLSGTNVMAVEVHQNGPTSTDLSFDFALTGISVPTQGAPYFALQPTNQVIIIGSNTVIRAAAAGGLPLSYQWRKDGTNIDGANGLVLYFNNAQYSDSGVYSCAVSNELGTAISSGATLRVIPPPPFDLSRDFSTTSNPNGVWSYGYKSTLGGPLVLLTYRKNFSSENGVPLMAWQVTYSDPPAIAKNIGTSTAISASGQFVAGPGTVWLGPGLNGDSRQYMVVRFTADRSGNYWLGTTVRPWLDGSLSGDCEFHVLLNGDEVFGAFLPPRTGTSYATNMPLTAGGTIDFVVGRGADGLMDGSGLKLDAKVVEAQIAAQNPPIILAQPSNARVEMGKDAVFNVIAVGAEPMSYQWQCNGTNIPGATESSLTLNSVQFSQVGNYSVQISNMMGVTSSSNAALSVRFSVSDLANEFSTAGNPNGVWSYGYATSLGEAFVPFAFSTQEILEGGASIDVWANDATGSACIKHNGSSVTGTSDGGQGNFPSGTVWFLPGVEGNTDNYGVIRFMAPKYNDGTYEIACAVQSYLQGPSAGDTDFHILKNGLEVFGRWMSGTNYGVSFSNNLALTAGDTIDFVVGRGTDGKAAGSGLKIQASLNLASTNAVGPTILVQPLSRVVSAESNVTFAVAACSTFPMQYQWYCNGTEMTDATSPMLTLSSLQFSNAGNYSVRIANGSGSVLSSNATLVIKPRATYDLTRDYSPIFNPTSRWSYGWATVLGSYFNLLGTTNSYVSQNGMPFRFWEKNTSETNAGVYFNPGPGTGTSDNGQGIYPPGTVWLLPGLEGRNDNFALARFSTTIFGAGYYQVWVNAQPQLIGSSAGDNEFHIVKGGVDIAASFLAPGTGTTYSNVLWLNRIESLDLAVGRGADGRCAGSGLKLEATVTPVSVAPLPLSILALPRNQTLPIGSNAVFNVAVNGAGPFTYQWAFNGVNIDRATNAVCLVTNLTTAQAGAYQVTITDSLGARVSAEATLTVLDFVDGLADTFEPNYNPFVWSAFSGTVQANSYGGAVSGPNSLWFGGSGTRFATTRGLNTANGGIVTFYICLGNTYNYNWDRPELTNDQVVLEYSLNGTNWTVLSRYDNTNYMAWSLQAVDIPTAARSTNTLFRWRQAYNDGGGWDSWALDNVRIFLGPLAPTILVQPTNQYVFAGGTVTFSAVVVGTPPLNYLWKFSGGDLQTMNSPILTIENVTTNFWGYYTLKISNSQGSTNTDPALLTVVGMGPSFKILTLSTNHPALIDHEALTGDDRGGIAVSANSVFVTGDNSTARFNLEDLSGGKAVGRIYDGLICDLRSAKVYCLANGTNLVTYYPNAPATTLQEIDGVTGQLTGNSIPLSMPVDVYGSSGMVYSGFGRAAVHTYRNTHVYHILLPSGIVLDLGAMPIPSHYSSESWATWGVAEYFDGELYLTYVQGYTTIARTRVSDNTTTILATFSSLGDMANFTVSPYLDRWYWHYESTGVFGGNNETLGFADATFEFTPDEIPPWIASQPQNQLVLEGQTATFKVAAAGAHPFSYQWLFNGENILDATNATLSFPVSTNNQGSYAVRVSNAYGTVVSTNATLTVVGWGEQFQILSLTSNNASTVEHSALTGSDRGGIAVSGSKVFYSGAYAASFNLGDLSEGTALGTYYPAQVSNLRTEMVYSLANGTNLITSTYNTTVTALLEHDPLTGSLTGRSIPLSTPIPLGRYSYNGLFSGFDRIVIHNYTRAYMILLPYGLVVDLGAMPVPPHASMPNYFYWGIAEYFDNTVNLVSVRDRYTITRVRVPDGATNVIATFTNLSSYMFAITASPYLDRWYFHHQSSSQFRSTSGQTLGFADATFAYTDPPRPPVIVSQPISQGVSAGSTLKLGVGAIGTRPLSYQWRFNGQDIPNATSPVLWLNQVAPEQAGQYSVIVSNQYGTAESTNAILAINQLAGDNFQIDSLTTNNVYVIEHSQYTGDNRGAIAASSSEVFYSGDSATVGFGLADLSVGPTFGCCYDALVSDLRTERLYSLANGTNLLSSSGGVITSLMEHDPATGLLNGNRIDLTLPITASGSAYNSTIGLFAGYGRIVLHNGAVLYNIDLPSGTVSEIGRMGQLTHVKSENWAYWGIAEYSQGVISLVYVRDSQTIVRTRVPDALTTPVAAFSSLGSMSGFTVSVYLNRWYFHHSGTSQFRSGDETLGFADARFNFQAQPLAPEFVAQPASQTAVSGSQIRLYSLAKGTQPLSYQWFFQGEPIEGATGPILTLTNLLTTQSGPYSVMASNDLGVAFSQEALLDVITLPGEPFQILELSTNNFYAIECNQWAGDNRGPIAASSNQLFYTGDSGTARFNLLDLSNGAPIGATNDALVSDLKSGLLYSLGTETNLLPNGGGIVTRLYELDPITGVVNGNYIPLSRSIVLSNNNTYSGYIGIFSGYGRIVVHDMAHLYDIALPSGTVTDLGVMAPPTHMSTECWAYWGVAEFVDGVIYLVYVRDYYSIARTRVPDGFTTNLVSLSYNGLGYGMTITVSPFLDRWYFHHYGSSLFRSGGDETVGFADATFSTSIEGRPPLIARHPPNVSFFQTNTATFQVLAVGSRPLSFRWQFNGQDLPDATNSTLVLTNVMPAQGGLYSAVVSNAWGCVTSQPAVLKVWTGLPPERNFRLVALTTNNLAVTNDQPIAGYERGPIAISTNCIFHTGSQYTGRFRAADLTEGTNFGARYEALVGNLHTEQVYAMATGTNLLSSSGGTVDTLWELDGQTGALTTNYIQLSRPITLGYGSGIFSGYDVIVLYSYQQYRTYMVDLPSGEVIDLGYTYLYNYQYYNWAFWGVAEQFNNSIYLVYVQDSRNIVRARVPDVSRTNLAVFSSLGYMTAITVSPSRARWYFHTDGSSQFSSFTETLGYADAIWESPPSISPILAQTILEDSSLGPIAFSLSDVQTSSDLLMVTGTSSNTNVVPDANVLIQGSGSNRFVTVTPLPNQSGTVTITLTTTNSNGAIGSSSFALNVLSVNDPPSFEFALTQHTALEDAGWQLVPYVVTNFSVGPNEYQGYTFITTNDNPQLFSDQPAIGVYYNPAVSNYTIGLIYTPAPDAFGTAVVTAVLQDGGGTNNGGIDTSAPRQLTITILPVNDPPGFGLIGAESIVPEDAGPQILPNWVAYIRAGPTNESDQSVSFVVTTDNPGLFSSPPAINASGTLTYLTAPNSNGVANVSVVICDNGGTNHGGIDTSAAPQFVIRVTPVNDAPVAYSQSVTLNQNTSASIVLNGFDVDGDPLTYSISTPPAHGTLSGVAPNLTYTPATNYAGADSFTFMVSDGQLTSAPATVSIKVVSANQAPIAVAGVSSPSMLHSNETGFAIVTLNNSNAVVVLDASRSSDADNDKLTYYWWLKDATVCFAQGMYVTNLFALGEWDVVLGVSDGTDVGSNTVHIRVLTASQAVRELMAKVTSAPIPRVEQKFLLNKLKLAIQEFEKGQSHPGLNHLREFIAKVQEDLASTPDTAQELVQAAEEIIFSFSGPELVFATDKLESLEQQVNGAFMARNDKKLLLNFLDSALDQFHKSHLEAAANFIQKFQSKLQENIVGPDLTEQFSATAQEILNVFVEYSQRPK